MTKAVKLAALEVTVGLSFGVMATWVGALPIVSVKVDETEAAKPEDPAYEAVTVSGDCSTRRPEMVQVALPLLRVTVSALAPALPQLGVARWPGPLVGAGSLKAKVTVPDGVPVAGATALTFAVKVSA